MPKKSTTTTTAPSSWGNGSDKIPAKPYGSNNPTTTTTMPPRPGMIARKTTRRTYEDALKIRAAKKVLPREGTKGAVSKTKEVASSLSEHQKALQRSLGYGD